MRLLAKTQGLGAEIRHSASIVSLERRRELRVEYNNRVRVPEKIRPSWRVGYATPRLPGASRAARDCLRFGHAKHHDFFPADNQGPVVVFIHGGYWQAFDGSSFSHLANGLNAHGVDVAIPSYDLCPGVGVDDIIAQMRMAARELARLGRQLVISGHSAGGHLAACMLATDWPVIDASLPADLVVAAYAISGLFDLGPLVETSINKALHLDAEPRRAAAPRSAEHRGWQPRRGYGVEMQRLVDRGFDQRAEVEQPRNRVGRNNEISRNDASITGQSVASMQAARCPPAEWPLMTSCRPSRASSRAAIRICAMMSSTPTPGPKVVAWNRDVNAVGIQPVGQVAERGTVERLPITAMNENDDRTLVVGGKEIDGVSRARTVGNRARRVTRPVGRGRRVPNPP